MRRIVVVVLQVEIVSLYCLRFVLEAAFLFSSRDVDSTAKPSRASLEPHSKLLFLALIGCAFQMLMNAARDNTHFH